MHSVCAALEAKATFLYGLDLFLDPLLLFVPSCSVRLQAQAQLELQQQENDRLRQQVQELHEQLQQLQLPEPSSEQAAQPLVSVGLYEGSAGPRLLLSLSSLALLDVFVFFFQPAGFEAASVATGTCGSRPNQLLSQASAMPKTDGLWDSCNLKRSIQNSIAPHEVPMRHNSYIAALCLCSA